VGDGALPTDDDSGTLRTDAGSDVPSGSGGNTTVPDAGNDVLSGAGMGTSCILATGEGDGTLHVDDGSTLHMDIGSDAPSSGGGLDVPIEDRFVQLISTRSGP
jgi:hypothetical protein